MRERPQRHYQQPTAERERAAIRRIAHSQPKIAALWDFNCAKGNGSTT